MMISPLKYRQAHYWLKRKYDFAICCEMKDKTCIGRFEWSNKSGKYKKIRSDWQQLCVSHHRRYDFKRNREILNAG